MKWGPCDEAIGGTLISKMEDEAYNSIEEMALHKYQWSNKQGQPKRDGGKFDADALTSLIAKIDAMTQQLDHLNVNVVDVCVPSPTYDSCGSFDHVTVHLLH